MNESELRRLFASLENGHPDDFFARVAGDVDWTVMGTHPLAGRYRDKQTFRERTFARLDKLVRNGIKLSVAEVLSSGDRAVVELKSDATAKDGRPFDNRYCWVLRFAEGKIVEVRAYLDSAMVQRLVEDNE